MRSSTVAVSMILGAAAAGAAGCWPSGPRAADPGAGREALGRVLEAWKRGDSLGAFQAASPPVTVVNRPWQQGAKLIEYEIEGPGEPNGFDIQYTVRIIVQDSTGKKSKEKARYVVSTAPRLVVVHAEAGG